jgi:hypothetical protein
MFVVNPPLSIRYRAFTGAFWSGWSIPQSERPRVQEFLKATLHGVVPSARWTAMRSHGAPDASIMMPHLVANEGKHVRECFLVL